MNSWKQKFSKSVLEKSEKSKAKITDVTHTNSQIRGVLKSNKEFKIDLTIEKGELFDMNCSCSSKTNCVHEAIFLHFLDEFPEILDDHDKLFKPKKSVLNVDCDDILSKVTSTKLNSFIKKELRNNNQFKYDFIKHFGSTSLIDKKVYEKKLKSIFSNSKDSDFRYMQLYDMGKLSRPLKSFMRQDIKLLIDMKEYSFACKLLNEIAEKLSKEEYVDDQRFYNIVYYYQDYAEILMQTDISKKQKDEMDTHLCFFAFFGF